MHKQRRCWRQATRPAALAAAAVVLLVAGWIPLRAQSLLPPDLAAVAASRSNLALAEPVISADAQLKARRAYVWREGQAHLILLEEDVETGVGSYGFRADRAVVRVDQETRGTTQIHHLSMYLENVRSLPGRGSIAAESPRLLVTASTRGQVNLETDLVRDRVMSDDPLVQAAAARVARYLRAISTPPMPVPPGPPLITSEEMALRQARREQIASGHRGIPVPPEYEPPARQVAAAPAERRPPAETPPQMAAAPTIPPVPPAPAAPTPLPPGPSTPATPAPEPHVDLASPPTPPAPAVPPPVDPQQSILPTGFVSLTFDRMVVQDGEGDEAIAVLFGDVGVMFHDPIGQQTMTLTAQNAVVFLDRQSAPAGVVTRVDSSAVRGVYLEDNVVASNGQYTVRAPRVYFDPNRNKAVILDAVMYTWDVRRQVPIYVRAEKIMMVSKQQFEARHALLTTSEFAEPHFAIASDRLTLVAEPGEADGNTYKWTAEGNRLVAGKTAVMVWPRLSGRAEELPIRSLDVGYSSNGGPQFRSRWDLFALSGQEAPEGVDLSGHLDYRGEHGPGIGVNLAYDLPGLFGSFEGYTLPHDTGDDDIGGRNDVEFDGDIRGYLQLQHRQYLPQGWEASLEAGYVSDPTFLEAFFPGEADLERQYETSLYFKKQQGDWATTLLGRYEVNDFTTQTTTLQAPGYTVDKMPELGFYQIGTSLWNNRLTYYTENRLTRARIRPGTDRPRRRGFNAAQSLLLFGIPPAMPFDQSLEAAGVPMDYVLRGDTRHEIQAPLKIGPLDAVPYLAGRVTGYDEDFVAFSGEEDNVRLWGAAGVRLHTQFSRTFETVDNRVLDLHRLRHIVEPNADIYVAETSIDPERLPVFDPTVEDVRGGFAARLGLRNTLQTQRGGPGRWRSVDWLVLDTDFVIAGDDTEFDRDRQFPADAADLPHFFGHRPEWSSGGDHFYSRLMWMVSDNLAIASDLTYDLERGYLAQWRIGGTLQHTPAFSTFVDFAELNALNSRLLSYGFAYELTRKYTLSLAHTIDLEGNQGRSIAVTLVRKLPRWRLVFLLDHNELDDDTTVGVVLVPVGLGSSRYTRPGGLHFAR